MSGNELQYGLAALGLLAIGGLFFYNHWQERKARKSAEQAFRSTHHDVLLDGEPEAAVPPAPGGRMEPALPGNEPVAAALDGEPIRATQKAPRLDVRKVEPTLPRELSAIDSVISIEAPAGIQASALFSTQIEAMAGINRNLFWYGWMDLDNRWFLLDARSPGSLNRVCVTMQLVDRHGAVAEREVDRFNDNVGRICEQFLALPRIPEKAETLRRAHELDAFCAEVDAQIAINIVANGGSFSGPRIQALAEAAGLSLHDKGFFQAIDETGQCMFVMGNQEDVPLTPEQIRHVQIQGLTLVLDVPRVTNPAAAFDRMAQFARQMADGLQGVLVDDNRSLLNERTLQMIRDQIVEFETRMNTQEIPAGGMLAQRLFS